MRKVSRGTSERKTRAKILWLSLFGALLSVLVLPFASAPTHAATGINQQLNYQARLLNSAGAVVPDGTYNLEVKIYQDGTGCVSGGTSPCGGTLKWTETRTGSNRVDVKNGYFSVQLGSVTAFGNNVDWNQDTLWLSINVGGTGTTATWDGEMTPFRRLSSTPYAMNAGKLGGLDATKFLQVAPAAVQVDAGTLDSIFVNKTGAAGNILRLQKNGADMMILDNTGKLALGGIAVPGTNLDVGGAIQQTGMETSDTGPTDANKWTKLGTCNITVQYQQCLSTINILGGYDGDLDHNSQATVNVRVKQQDPLGAAPIVNLQLNGVSKFITKDDIKTVTTQNTGAGTIVELWGRITNIYEHWSYTPLLNTGGSLRWSWTPTSGFSAALPAGTQTAATYGTVTAGGLQVQNAAGAAQLTVDTTTSRVYLGPTAGDTTGTLMVFGKKTSAGDPAGVDGAMYYNASMGVMRCYTDGAWGHCSDPTRLSRGYNIQEDFIGSSTGGNTMSCSGATAVSSSEAWACYVGGTGAGIESVEANAAKRPGMIRLKTGSTAAGFGSMYLSGGSTPAFFIGGGESFETAINIPTLSNGTQRYLLHIGLCDVNEHGSDCSNGVYFEYDSNTSANWRYATAQATTRTKVSSSKPVATGWTNLKFVATSAANVDFYVKSDGEAAYTKIGNITTNIPTTTNNVGTIMFFMDKYVGTTSSSILIDYADYWNDFTSPR